MQPARDTATTLTIFNGRAHPIRERLEVTDLLQQTQLILTWATVRFAQFLAVFRQQVVATYIHRSNLAKQTRVVASLGREGGKEEHARHHDRPDD